MKQIIFRVDDRLIHGQVVEGWIKNFDIPRVIIVNDTISKDMMQQFVYSSVVPGGTKVLFFSIEELHTKWQSLIDDGVMTLLLFSSIKDLMVCADLISDNSYVNIGCISTRQHSIKVTDTVYLEEDEVNDLKSLAAKWDIYIKKLPWESNTSINDIR